MWLQDFCCHGDIRKLQRRLSPVVENRTNLLISNLKHQLCSAIIQWPRIKFVKHSWCISDLINRTFFPTRCNQSTAILTAGNHSCRPWKLAWSKNRLEVHDENRSEVTKNLYEDTRRIVPDATQSCLVSRYPCDKQGQGERKGCEVYCEEWYSVEGMKGGFAW